MKQKLIASMAEFESSKEYWQNKLSGEIVEIKLPSDFPDAAVYLKGEYAFSFEDELVQKILSISKNQDSLLYVFLLASIKLLLFKYTGLDDITVGSPVYTDEETDGDSLDYNKCIALRDRVEEDMSFKDLLKEVKKTVMDGYANQHYPMDDCLRDLGYFNDEFYIYKVVFMLENIHKKEDLDTILDHYSNSLSFSLLRSDEGIKGKVVYNANQFSEITIRRMIEHYTNVLSFVSNDSSVLLKQVLAYSDLEKELLLYGFNDTSVEYPDKTIHKFFEEQVDKTPDKKAVVFGETSITYRELDQQANRVANYLIKEHHVKPDTLVGILIDNSIDQVIAMLGVLKAGAAYIPVSKQFPEERIKCIVDDAKIGVMISVKKYIKLMNRLQWSCDTLDTFLLLDSDNVYAEQEAERNELMDEELWLYVGENATDDIEGGGWVSSYTGEHISRQEMDEYGDNILKKLMPHLNENIKVFEAGCASGISMFRIAKHVGSYYGTDLSRVIIEKNKKRIEEENITNIKLKALPAHEIDKVEENGFDILIINSVIQAFQGHNYLRQVISKLIDMAGDQAMIFLGDIMDQDLKNDLTQSLIDFKKENPEYSTKTDFSAELFLSRNFFKDLMADMKEIKAVDFTGKIYTIENELTKFRYDTVLHIDKTGAAGRAPVRKNKNQHDKRVLEQYDMSRPSTETGPGNLAYSIFTSGTTGKPKGVLVEHKGVINMAQYSQKEFGAEPDAKFMRFASNTFDASIWEVYTALLCGGELHVIPEEVIGNYEDFENYMNTHGVTCGLLPPTYLVNLNPENFNSFRYCLVGGSIVSVSLLNRWKDKFQFYNVYGPTEGTVISTFWRNEGEGLPYATVPIGKPLPNTRAYILDKNLQLAPRGIAGELCIAGAGLARGYLNRPELTNEKFIENPYIKGERIYRTGDLARWLPDGNIEYLGRIDTQVKIRGFRIELGEIEHQIMRFDGIKDAVVAAIEDSNEDRYLCAYYVADRPVEIPLLREHLSRSLADYMVPAFYVPLDKMPLTQNGKPDKKKLPKPQIVAGANYEAPADEVEETMVKLWEEILQINGIGINDHFFELGGHSLKATLFVSRVHKELNVTIPLAEIFKAPYIKQLAQYVRSAEKNIYSSIPKAPESEYYPLSSAQKRLFIVNQFDGSLTSYNMPNVTIVLGNLHKERFNDAFNAVVRRHDSLRTSFGLVNGEPVQRIQKDVNVHIDFIELDEDLSCVKNLIGDFIKPFDLSIAPLLRVKVVKLKDTEVEEDGNRKMHETHLLMFDMHHIVSDGTSISILISELIYLYNGDILPELKIQYKDFAVWQNALFGSGHAKKQEDYWLGRFSGEIPVLNLATDYTRPPIQSFEGDFISFGLEMEASKKLYEIASKTGSTIYMVLLAAYNTLLYKLTGQEDIIVGSPVAGRPHADIHNTIGMFVNTLAMRNFPDGNQTFRTFLEEVRDNALNAFENQDYQFEELVSKLDIRRDYSRNPLFDTMFMVHNIDFQSVDIAGLRFMPYEFETRVAKFDLSLAAIESYDGLFFNLEYCTKLFNKDTILRMSEQFINLLGQIADNMDIVLTGIDIITDEDKKKLLYEFNETQALYPKDQSIHQLFEKMVEQFPYRTALVCEEKEMTYYELNCRANQLARVLKNHSVGSDCLVGMVMNKSPEMIVGMLAVLKAGGAYLPIDPDYPEERIRFTLSDSGTRIVLTQKSLKDQLEFDGAFLVLDEEELYQGDNSNLKWEGKQDDLAYVIYTSGTTGRPKGAMIDHKNVVRLMINDKLQFDFSENDVWTMFHSYCFDFSVWEMYGALLYGGKLVIIPKRVSRDTKEFLNLLKKQGVTVLNQTPTAFYSLINEELSCQETELSIRYVIFGGEALKPLMLKEWREKYPGTKLINMYGITETTVHVTYKEITENEIELNISNIGKPIPTLTTYIMDKNLNLLPIGAAGELCVGGDGVGRGYLNRPELTDEKFVQNPYNPEERMYRSGDLAKMLPSGEMEYLGRIDHQVKIRGFRIELGEIESEILKYDGVREVTVQAREEGGNRYLCAYVVSDAVIEVRQIREYLQKTLPDYMIPSYFVQIEKMPVTSNGKIDRKALPEPKERLLTVEYVAPENEVQQELAAIWQSVLGLERVGINDNFFEIGGNSILLIKMHSKIEEKFPGCLSITEIFMLPTVGILSEYIKMREYLLNRVIPVKTLSISREYFEDNSENSMHAVFNFQIQDSLYEKLMAAAKTCEVEVNDILLSMYVYLLSEITEENIVTVQAMLYDTDVILSLDVDFEDVESSQDLLKKIRQMRQSIGENYYYTSDVARVTLNKNEDAIVPLIYDKRMLASRAELLDLYDLVLEVNEQSDRISFKCEFNAKRLKEERIAMLLERYSKLLKAFVSKV